MSEAAAKAFPLFQADVGNDEGTGEWFQITQEQIDQFADVTHDHQFIHVDPERAAAGPFGTTIAHGFLTLSLLVHLQGSLKGGDDRPAPKLDGLVAGVNYGFDKVRFISPVPVGSRVRMRATLKAVEATEQGVRARIVQTFERDGQAKPICVAESLVMYFAR